MSGRLILGLALGAAAGYAFVLLANPGKRRLRGRGRFRLVRSVPPPAEPVRERTGTAA